MASKSKRARQAAATEKTKSALPMIRWFMVAAFGDRSVVNSTYETSSTGDSLAGV